MKRRCSGWLLVLACFVISLFPQTASAEENRKSRGDIREEKKLAGYYVSFTWENGESHAALKQGILTLRDGVIAKISDFEEGIPGVTYLDPACVIMPGLLDIHSHIDYNNMQLWQSEETDLPWDNRFEWRSSAGYRDSIKDKAAFLREHWEDIPDPGNPEACMGDLLQYFTELQAAAGGTTLIQGSEDDAESYDCTESHRKIRLIRSTACPEDLGRDNGQPVADILQLYRPDAELTPEDPSTYLPPLDTSAWQPVRAPDWKTGEEWLGELLKNLEDKADSGFLIHMSEGRAGDMPEMADAYSRAEFETFMKDLESAVSEGRFTAEDVRNAHLALIHACAVNPESETDRSFLEKYGIGIIWSPVSNLLLYADTPDFSKYLEDSGIPVALGSDWSPTGSKTIRDECRTAYELIARWGKETEATRENLLKACTVNPAVILGEERLGNIKEGCFADLFIMRTEGPADRLDPVLETFVTGGDEDVEGVLVRGEAVYGTGGFLESFTGETEPEFFGQYDEPGASGDGKYFFLPELFRGCSLSDLYAEYREILSEAGLEMSKVRAAEDPLYREVMEELIEAVPDDKA